MAAAAEEVIGAATHPPSRPFARRECGVQTWAVDAGPFGCWPHIFGVMSSPNRLRSIRLSEAVGLKAD